MRMSKIVQLKDLDGFIDRFALGFERGEGSQHFLRSKIPNGKLTVKQFRDLALMSEQFGRGYAEVTDRQDIQMHWIEGENAFEIFSKLDEIGFCTDKCGQAVPGPRYGDVRNIVSCPVSGINKNEILDVTKITEELTTFYSGNKDFMDLPRKFKISITGCENNCTASEIQDLGLVATKNSSGEAGFHPYIGGGIGVGPRIADSLGVFLEKEDVFEFTRSLIEIFRDKGQREGKAKARFKWLVQSLGVNQLRSMVEEKIGKHLEDSTAKYEFISSEHEGIASQKQSGYSYLTIPILGGILSSQSMVNIADIAESYGWPEIRLTPFQNIILAGIRDSNLDRVESELLALGFNIRVPTLLSNAIACAGNFCAKSPENPKDRIIGIVKDLKIKFKEQLDDINITLASSGCPNSCGRHLIADIGIQGVEIRKGDSTFPAYNLYLGGGIGGSRTIGKLVGRRVPAENIKEEIQKIIESYIKNKKDTETFKEYFKRQENDISYIFNAGKIGEA